MKLHLSNEGVAADGSVHFQGVFEFAAVKYDDPEDNLDYVFDELDDVTVVQFPQKTSNGCTCLRGWAHDGVSHKLGECNMLTISEVDGGENRLPWCQIDRRYPCESEPAGEGWDVCPSTTLQLQEIIEVVEDLLEEIDMESLGYLQFMLLFDDEKTLVVLDLDDSLLEGEES